MSESEVSRLLAAWGDGDEAAQARLIPLVYEELHRVAQRAMRSERQMTLQPTALVHEAFLRLTDAVVQWNGRVHFFAVAARLMRRILVDEARRRKAEKRGGGEAAMPLEEALIPVERADELLALDDALASLSQLDERKARVVELRFFAGMTIEETAAALELSHATVERDFKMAKAWLADALQNPPAEED